jgi:5,10-methylene-tetrahydrofolate dehydrogenase/methenyl tetrahydrofolate cyclohydrolase
MECIKRGAEVFSVNHLMKPYQIAEIALMSDFIFSATGQIHLVDESFVRDDKTQIVIDIGYGIRD